MVNLALIGAGAWGQNFLKTALLLDNCRIKYVYSQSLSTLDPLSDQYIKTTSLEDLLDKKIDGIIIASPASSHYQIAKKFLENNFNLLIEKPLTTNLKDAIGLQKIWQGKKPRVLVGHLYLYEPAIKECKRLLKELGSIESISFEGLLSQKRDDVSVIWDWGPHPVSIMLDLIGKPVKKIKIIHTHATRNQLDELKIELTFSNGIRGMIHIGWSGSKKTRRLIINGLSGKKIVFDNTNTEHKISFYKGGKSPEFPSFNHDLSLNCELKEFVDSIQNGTSDINLGVEVVKVLSEIEKLAKSA